MKSRAPLALMEQTVMVLIFALAAGKLTGSLVYFWFRMASMG